MRPAEATPVEFWFDFSSPYAFFASLEIDRIEQRHRRRVLWRPFMLGVAFKQTGMTPLSRTPMRGDYARHDWARLARQLNVPFRLPSNHPIAALPASRAYYWIEEHHPEAAKRFARASFNGYFVDNLDLSRPDIVADLAATFGVPRVALLEGISSQAIKDRLKRCTAEAIDKGVFGSPFFIADGEPFWGADRMPMLDAWLETAGW